MQQQTQFTQKDYDEANFAIETLCKGEIISGTIKTKDGASKPGNMKGCICPKAYLGKAHPAVVLTPKGQIIVDEWRRGNPGLKAVLDANLMEQLCAKLVSSVDNREKAKKDAKEAEHTRFVYVKTLAPAKCSVCGADGQRTSYTFGVREPTKAFVVCRKTACLKQRDLAFAKETGRAQPSVTAPLATAAAPAAAGKGAGAAAVAAGLSDERLDSNILKLRGSPDPKCIATLAILEHEKASRVARARALEAAASQSLASKSTAQLENDIIVKELNGEDSEAEVKELANRAAAASEQDLEHSDRRRGKQRAATDRAMELSDY
jgi:hypothetical protein